MEQQRSALTVLGRDSNGTPRTLAVDSDGQLLASMKGNYGGASKTIAVDENGRMLADALLMNTMEFDFMKYYTGCDMRFCVGNDTLTNFIYRIKSLNSALNVIRFISAFGSSSSGYYLVSMGDEGELCRSIGINEAVVDRHVLKFGNIGSDFNISFADSTVRGIITDIKTPSNRVLIDEVTFVVGDETDEGYKTLDFDGATYISKVITGDTTVLEFTFPETDVDSICSLGDILIDTPSTTGASAYMEYYADGAWTQALMLSLNSSPGATWKYYDYVPKTGVSKCRITIIRGNAGTVTVNVRDVCILKTVA